MIDKIKYKNILFYNFTSDDFIKLLNKNGLFVFPAAYPLATLKSKSEYHKSLINSDYIFFDSGYFVLLLKYLKGIKVSKFSGYKFLKLLFEFFKTNKRKKIFLVDSSVKFSKNNLSYLKTLGCKHIKSYVAPFYNKDTMKDFLLLEKIIKYRPEFIIINLGGGTQEVLGSFLKNKIKFKCKIICTGAAISYFTKDQAPISNIIDKLYLGWLVRIFYKPSIFFPRYLKCISLFSKVLQDKVEIILK